MAANPVGNGSFQFQFYFDDGTYAYILDTEITHYFPAFTNEEFSCKWIVQKTTTTQVLLAWQITAPSNDISGQTVKKTGRIETYPTNRVSVTCAEGANISLNVYYKPRNADKSISFDPSYFSIDVMKDIALTADYI